MYRHYVGIDIAAETFTAAWLDAGEWCRAESVQTQAAYDRLVQDLSRVAAPEHTLVVMEVTGTYWGRLAWALHRAGFVVSVIPPGQAHLFARLEMQRTKTDRIDAQLLAEFARQRQPAPWVPPPALSDQLQQRLSQRHDLLATKTQESNRLQALQHHPRADPSVLDRLRRHMAFLQAEIDSLDRELAALLAGDHVWAAAAQRLLTIPGVGPITAAWILVATQCFAYCNTPAQAAAYAGLVPHRQESGTSRRGHRAVGRTGHAALRRTLYMAALAAARHNPCVKPLYDRLLEHGKPNKVARVAAARKLLHIAWAVVVKERDFDPSFARPPEFVPVGS